MKEVVMMKDAVERATSRAASRQWTIEDLSWDELQPEKLTDMDRSIVKFITFIEDHIPGYLTYFLKTFPVVGEDLPVEQVCFNREYFRFLIAWAYDEERHASALTRYQVDAGMNDAQSLAVELALEGQKAFTLPYEHPVQAFTYTLIQEKATQLFYQRFAATVSEPLLVQLLGRLARDEARHFAFYAHLVSSYLEREGAEVIPNLREVVKTFRMPLADTLKGYWRWSLRIADATAYDHTEAYEALVRLVQGLATSRNEATAEELVSFVGAIRGIGQPSAFSNIGEWR